MADNNPAALTQWVYRQLLSAYGVPSQRPRQDPLSELVQTILSQNTSDLNTARSYAELRRRFPTWEQVLQADTSEIADAIRIGGLADIKAPRIKAILQQLHEETGCLSLAQLETMPTSQAKDYLRRLKGVGSKTAACVLLFSLGKPALPVDTHVHRVSLRVGLVPPQTTAEKTEILLESYLSPEQYYPFHLNMISHGRRCCTALTPHCADCPLNSRCHYYAASQVVREQKVIGPLS